MNERTTNLQDYVRREWGAGDQLRALRFYLSNSVEILAEYQERNYQGECFAILSLYSGRRYFIWRDSFGSCKGCDALEGEDIVGGLEYIKDTLVEGSTKEFTTLDDIELYMRTTPDTLWKDFPIYLIQDAKATMKEKNIS